MEKIFPKSFFKGDRSVSEVAGWNPKNTQGLTAREAFKEGAVALQFTGQTPALCSDCYAQILEHGVEAAIQKWGVRKGNPIKPSGGVRARYDLIIVHFERYWVADQDIAHIGCGFSDCSQPAGFRFACEEVTALLPNGGYEFLILHKKTSLAEFLVIGRMDKASFLEGR